MSETLLSVAWMFSAVAVVAWLAVGRAVALGHLSRRSANPWRSRLVWLPVWLLSGLAGVWGIGVHETSSAHFAEVETVPPVSETTRSEFRSPFVVRTALSERDAEGVLIRSEERSRIQLPLALLLFFGTFLVLALRGDRACAPNRGGLSLLLYASLSLQAACDGSSVEHARPDRIVAEVQWDTLFLIESELEDSLLFRLDRLAADAGGFSVLDGLAPRVARFDWDGNLRWYAGRKGGGPGELQQPRDLRTDEAGASWVLDVAARRISGFDGDGRLFQEVPLQDVPPSLDEFALAPGASAFFGIIPEDGALEVIELDREGSVRDASRILLSRSGEPKAMALQGKVGFSPGLDRWIYAFSAGDGLYRFRGTSALGAPSPYPDAVPFARIVEEVSRSGMSSVRTFRMPERTFGAAAAAVGEDVAYVLLLDDDGFYRLLDVYDLSTGEYVETLRLPRSATAVAVRENRLLLGHNTPHPIVLALDLDSRRTR